MQRRKNTRLALCGLAAFGLTCVGTTLPTAYAGTKTWTGAGSSNSWGLGSNWSGGAPPATGDDVFFTGSAAITQLISLLNTAYSLNSLTFNPGSSAKAFTITAGGANNVLSIGAGGIVNNTALTQTIDAPVALTTGTTFNAAIAGGTLSFLGTSSNASNGISMGGNNLTITGSGNTTVASPITSNSSALLIKNGTGTLTLTGNGNALGASALFNNGTTLIQGANSASYASLSAAFGVYIGYNANDNGTVVVAGTDSNGHASTLNLANGSLYIGSLGSGTLNVTGGGRVLSNFGDLGAGSGIVGTATISGSDGNGLASTWNVLNGPLYVGAGGTGILNIMSGGKVTTGTGITYLANSSGSHATLNINGGSLTTDILSIGSGATPSISLTNPTAANGGGYALTLGNANGSTSLGVAVGNAAGGPGGINKIGTGTLTLSAANTFTGGLLVSGGTVAMAQANALSPDQAVTVTGSGSTLTNTGNTLLVGNAGTGNLLVSSGGSVTSASAFVGNGASANGTATVTGAGSTLTLNGSELDVAYNGTGVMNVTGGGKVNSVTSVIAHAAGSNGTLTVSGTDASGNASLFTTGSNNLYAGYAGTGTMNITGGGKVTSGTGYIGTFNGSVGTVTVSGADVSGNASQWNANANGGLIEVGSSGGGTLNIQSAGLVSASSLSIGYNSDGVGTLNVTGSNGAAASTLVVTSGGFEAGHSGMGTANVTGGGKVTSVTSVVGYDVGSVGILTISGTDSSGNASLFTTGSNRFYAGYYGQGTVSVTGGGQLTTGTGYIGNFGGSTGVVNVSGASAGGSASTWNIGDSGLLVGYQSSATLNITNGGKVTTGAMPTYLNYSTGSSSTLNINGGSLTSDTLVVGSGSVAISLTNPTAANGGGYALNLGNANGSSTIATPIADAAGGAGGIRKTGTGTLTLNAANTFSGGMQIDGGSVILGNNNALQNSTATINVNNGLNLNNLSQTGLGGLSGSGNLSLGATEFFVGSNNASTTYAGTFSSANSSAGFTKRGTGTLTLTGTNSVLNGTTYFDGGTTSIQGANGGYASLTSSASTSFSAIGYSDNGTVTVSGTSSAGTPSSWSTNGGGLDVGYYNTGTLNVTGGGLVTSGYGNVSYLSNSSRGTVTVSGISNGVASTWNSGALTVGNMGTGILNVTAGGKVNTGAGTTTLSSQTNSYSTLNINGGSMTTNSIAIGSGNTPTISLTNPTAANGGGYALNLGGSNGSTTLGMVIADAAGGAGGIRKTGTGTLTLNAANTFSGGMQIDGGSVVLGNTYALQNSTATINVNNGLNLNSITSGVILGGLAGNGNLSLATNSFGVGQNNTSTIYGGVLSSTATSVVNFNKFGTGSLTLTGVSTLNRYFMIVGGGSLIIQGANSGSYASLTTASSTYVEGATMTVSGTNGSGIPSAFNNSSHGMIVGDDGLVGILNITGGGMVSSGTGVMGGYASGSVGNVTVSGVSSDGIASTWNNSSLIVGNIGAGTLNVTAGGKVNTGMGATTLSSQANSSSTLNINGGSLTTDSITVGAGNTPSVSLTNPTAANGGGYALNLGNANGSSTIATPIGDAAGGAGGIQKTGTGTLTLSGASTYTGGTLVGAGKVIGSGGTISGTSLVSGPLGKGLVTVAAGATLNVGQAPNAATTNRSGFGTLALSALTLTGGSATPLLTFDLGATGSTDGSTNDLLRFSGSANSLVFSGAGAFNVGFASASGSAITGAPTYQLMTFATPIDLASATVGDPNARFTAVGTGNLATPPAGTFFWVLTNGKVTGLKYGSAADAPEPAALALLVPALLPAIAAVRRRRA